MKYSRIYLLVLTFFVFAACNDDETAPEVSIASIEVTEAISFGSIAVNNSTSLNFSIANTGTADLVVSNISGLSDAYVVDWTAGTIAPSESQEVTITFTPTEVQNYDGTLTISSNSNVDNTTIAISAESIAGASGDNPFGIFQQFQGNYNVVSVGNSMNNISNTDFETTNGYDPSSSACTLEMTDNSAAELNLNGASVVSAYLYWSGSTWDGSETVPIVQLNGNSVITSTSWSYQRGSGFRWFFSHRADVTTLVSSTGSGTYTVSDFDVRPLVERSFTEAQNASSPDHHCFFNTFYAGWSLVVVTEDQSFGNNLVTIHDGFTPLPENVGSPSSVSFTLTGLTGTSADFASLQYLAWEGDSNISTGENLLVNGTMVSNTENPENSIFNQTNYNSGTTTFNVDSDLFDISSAANNTTDLSVQISSGRDFALLNNITTVLRNE